MVGEAGLSATSSDAPALALDERARRVAAALGSAFFLFYLAQVSAVSGTGDVPVYAARALQPTPVLEWAFFDSRALGAGEPLPNYHLLHTLVLWVAYHVAPEPLARSVWPAGAVSALAGAATAALTFLLWRRAGLAERAAAGIALVSGLQPAIWYHATLGEVYALQLAFTTLLAFASLGRRTLLAALALLGAVLTSPTAGASGGLVLLGGVGWALRRGPIVGALALAAYLAIFAAIGSDPLAIFTAVGSESGNRSLAFAFAGLVAVVALNLGLGLLFAVRGSRELLRSAPRAALGLALATAPQLLLPFAASEFVQELGSMLLALFWAACAPIGMALEREPRRWAAAVLASFAILALSFWLLPDRWRGMEQLAAANALRGSLGERTLLLGRWIPAVGVAAIAFDYDLDTLERRYLNLSELDPQTLAGLPFEEALFLRSGPSWFRRLAARVPVAGFELRDLAPRWESADGALEALAPIGPIEVYRWTAARRGAGAVP